jgi:outer membrane protein OmpA-like peptidoglycan-associated protein
MPDGYSWSELRDSGTYRLPGPEHIGWWAAVAMLMSVLLHVAVFLMLDRMKIALRFEQARELNTRAINIRQVEVRPMEAERSAPPEEVVTPPENSSTLLEEVDLLSVLPPDQEIDIKPEIQQAEYALQMQNPALEGDPQAIAMEISSGLEIEADLPEFGREPESIQPAAIGQVTVDPGAVQMDDGELGKFTEEVLKHGAGGNVEQGALDGITSLDDLLDLPPNILLNSKTMLPSDLLFEFNSDALRESAKVGLMKLALLMDRNPKLFCWIEGHTDLIGGDDFNLELSIRRAEAVKRYLVDSIRMDASRIFTRGYGRYQPLVTTGDRDAQAINRRVEIRMRKTPPSEEQMKIQPERAVPVEPPPPPPRALLVKPTQPAPAVQEAAPVEPPPPRAVLVKPQRALPVEEAPPPRAQAVEEPAPPRAQPVEPPPAMRALPVEE